MSIGELGRRLARLWRRDQEASQLAEEMRLHVELRARRLEELGDDGAHYAALRQFGNRAILTDASASVWGWNWWERWLQDIRHGARGLMRSPGFTAVVIGTLAAGLGMNTAVFSMVNGVVLRSLPYPNPDGLVSLWEEQIKPNLATFNSRGSPIGRAGGPRRTTVSVANIADYSKAQAFSAIASYDLAPVNLTGTGTPERLQAEAVSAGFFEVLGIGPAIGRTFTTADDRQQAAPVAIVTYAFWQRRLGGETQVLDRDLLLDGVPHRIIGVMPAGFRSPLEIALPEAPPEIFVPAAYSKQLLTQRGDHDVNVVGRLRPGASLAAARSELEAISAGLQKQYPTTNSNIQAVIAPLADDLVRSVSGLLWILLGTSGLIVLIMCVNVANLMLVRSVRRQHESTVRMALGAGRGGLVRQCLAESMVLAGAGCIAGIGVGWAFLRILISIAPPGTPRLNDVAIDWQVFAVSAAIATATGVLFGIAPAWQASRALAAEALKTSARSSGTKSQARWRAALTTTEVALSLVLLIGAGLLLRSFMQAMGVGLGFETERVLAMNIALPQSHYPTATQRFEYFRRLEERVRSLPGVEAAAFANRMPMRGGWSTSVFVDTAPGLERVPDAQAVSTGYFETLGIPLLRGRTFSTEDRGGTSPTAIVNQEFARQYLNGRDPLGHEVQRGALRYRIVGVVNDIRRGGKLDEVKPEIYFAAAQAELYPVRLADFAVRAAGDPRRLVQAIQNQVWTLDRDQPVTNVRTMQEIITRSVAQNRFQMALLLAFAAVAVLLASIGIFGVLSFVVNQRMNELGIRIALGASPHGIVALVLRQAGAWVAAGTVVGIAGAALLTRYLETLLFQVKRTDPWTYAGAIGLLAAVALGAAFLPARRGSRADPMKALRYE